jgi:hypothetical protein
MNPQLCGDRVNGRGQARGASVTLGGTVKMILPANSSSAGGAVEISRWWSEAQPPEARRERVALKGRRTKADLPIRANPASLPGREQYSMTCPGGFASLHHRLISVAPTGARNEFAEFATSIEDVRLMIFSRTRCGNVPTK